MQPEDGLHLSDAQLDQMQRNADKELDRLRDVDALYKKEHAKNIVMQAILEDCQRALQSLPDDALGISLEGGWPYRDELLSNIKKALES